LFLRPLPLLKELHAAAGAHIAAIAIVQGLCVAASSSSLLKELHDIIVQMLYLYITVPVAATSSYRRRTA